MAAEFICDGCGKREPACYGNGANAIKPLNWYQRSDADGPQHACSRECIKRIAAKSGKTGLVAPL